MYASEECKVVHHPSKMAHTNDEGERREIYMPTRDLYKAMAHIRKEEWDELAKFPRWGKLFPPSTSYFFSYTSMSNTNMSYRKSTLY